METPQNTKTQTPSLTTTTPNTSTPEKEELTIFVGGLSSKCTEASLKKYFQQFGSIDGCEPQTWKKGGRKCRGFALVHCADEPTHSAILSFKKHLFNGRTIECKRWFSSKEKLEEYNKQLKLRKLFVGGLPSKWRSEELEQFFKSYGKLDIAYVITHPKTGRSKGFGYIVFHELEGRNKVLSIKDFNVGKKVLSVSEYSNKETIKKKKNRGSKCIPPAENKLGKKKIQLKKSSEIFQLDVPNLGFNQIQQPKIEGKAGKNCSESTSDSGNSTIESTPLRKGVKKWTQPETLNFEESVDEWIQGKNKLNLFGQRQKGKVATSFGLFGLKKGQSYKDRFKQLGSRKTPNGNLYSHFGEFEAKELAEKFDFST